MSNLEPIEETDLDLKGKFLGGETSESKNISGEKEAVSDMKEIKDLEFPPEKPVVGQERNAEKEKTYSKILSKVRTSQAVTDEPANAVQKDAEETSVAETAEAKVDKLVKLAMVKGVVHAVKVAKHLEDNYALDEFHDKLMADEFHKALVEKGLIKEL